MKIDISEYTFQAAFLREITNKAFGTLRASPFVPSLHDEGTVGYDAHLPDEGVDYYLQFKMANYFVHRSSKFFSEGPFYNDHYFRFDLHAKNDFAQHEALRALCADDSLVFYISPNMVSRSDFNAAFKAQTVMANSAWIPLAECDSARDGGAAHSITYQSHSDEFCFHSDVRRRKGLLTGGVVDASIASKRSRLRKMDRPTAMSLVEKVISAIDIVESTKKLRLRTPRAPLLPFDELHDIGQLTVGRRTELLLEASMSDSPQQIVGVAATLLREELDCVLVIVGQGDPLEVG